MADQDNFEEDDLFADLYENDDAPAKVEPQAERKIEAAPAEVKAEAQVEERQNNGGGVEQMYDGGGGDGDDDDEVDFNLGNGGSHEPASYQESSGPGIKEDGKMFIGGLNWETTDQSLKDYFSQFGEVIECTVMRDGASGRSRGFGFLTFKDAKTVNIVMVKEHYLDGKIIDPKRAIPRDEQERTSKIFVGGVSQEATEHDFKTFFTQFGRVIDATLMMDKDTGRPRGFGFVTFDSEAAVDACLSQPLEILGKSIEVKKAQPRGNIREEEEARGSAGRGSGPGGWKKREDNQNANQQANQAAPGGITPQMMAQNWQRMQQYMQMMQQAQAMQMGGMGAMNPQLMQQMQLMQQFQTMQRQMQMQQAGGAGGRSQSPSASVAGGMSGMTPQMMQQMQQMQQMQGGGSNGGSGGGGNFTGGQTNPGGRVNTPGYNAYEQQIFEQQKYEQQQMARARLEQSQYAQGAYGGGGMGGPTSWEGMYDDVPQPTAPVASANANGGPRGRSSGGSKNGSVPPDPAKAPPANAPTGPKNAGKPGANYRGGGRGGQRGYHPYAR